MDSSDYHTTGHVDSTKNGDMESNTPGGSRSIFLLFEEAVDLLYYKMI